MFQVSSNTIFHNVSGPKAVKTFFKISSFVFPRRKQVMQVWNDIEGEISFLGELFLLRYSEVM